MTETTFDLSYRAIGYPPQRVFLAGLKIGRVEYRGDGWNAFDREGEMVGFATSKSGAGQMLAHHQTEKDSTND